MKFKILKFKEELIFVLVCFALASFLLESGVPRDWLTSFFLGGAFFCFAFEYISTHKNKKKKKK